MKTAIDTQKEKAQMLIESANGGSFTVSFNEPTFISGYGISSRHDNGTYDITIGKLEQLKKEYTWMTNF